MTSGQDKESIPRMEVKYSNRNIAKHQRHKSRNADGLKEWKA